MGIWFGVRKMDEDRIEYAVTWTQRVVFTLIGVTILLAIFSTTEHVFQASNSVALILVGICAFAAVYTESWRFDRAKQTCEHLIGIPGMLRTRNHSLSGSASFKLVKTDLPARRGYTSLLLILGEDKPLKLDMIRGAGSQKLETVAEELARFCDLVVEEDEA